MPYTIITPPAVEPIDLKTAKAHTRITHNLEDHLVRDWIATARIRAEARNDRALCQQTVLYTMSKWPSEKVIYLPKSPLQSVTSVIYTDSTGTEHALDNYTVDANVEPGMVILDYSEIWPSAVLYPRNAIKITFVAGYPTYVGTVDTAGTAVTWKSGDKFNTSWTNGQRILINGEPYRIVSVTDSENLTLESTAGNNTDVSYTANEVPLHFRQAMQLLISHYDTNRTEVAARGHIPQRMPEAAAALLRQDTLAWSEEWNR